MARNERMKHMQLYPGWSARDNYGVKKKRVDKGKKRDKNQGKSHYDSFWFPSFAFFFILKNVLIRKNVELDSVLNNKLIGVNIVNERKNVYVIRKTKQHRWMFHPGVMMMIQIQMIVMLFQ